MPDPVTGVLAAASIGGSVLSSKSANKAATTAAEAQTDAAELGVAEIKAAREELRKLLDPWVKAGGEGLAAQLDLAGLGTGSQADAIGRLEESPLFQALAMTGEDAILQNASATGGLRGGNVQGALAQFRPALLNQFINDQFSRLGNISLVGQNSAAGVGSAGMQSGAQIAQLFGEAGAAQAGAALAKGQNNPIAGILNTLGPLFGSAIGNAQKTPGGLF